MSSPELDRPWLRRADWASGRVQSDEGRTRGTSGFELVFAVVWIGSLVGFAGLLLSLGVTRVAPYLFLAAFAAAALPLVAGALPRGTRSSVFEMTRVPAAPGGTLEGVVWIAARLRPDWGVKIALTCLRLSTSRNGVTQVAWETDAVVDILPDSAPGETRVPIRIDIPATCPGAHPTRALGGHFWRLEIEGRSGSRAFHDYFEVPVFVTEETVAALQREERFEERQPSAPTTLVDHPQPGVTRYRFPFRSGSVVFTAALPLLSPLALLMVPAAPFVAVIVMLSMIGVGALAQYVEPASLEINAHEIILRNGYRGWLRQRRFPLGEVRRVWLDSGHGRRAVKIRTRGLEDADVSLALGVMEGRWLAAELRATLTAAGASLED